MPASRIISLVPSITELLHDLGLEEEVVGITKFCVHPNKWFRTKTRIGGTKNISIEKIHALNPDLIIANKEENVAEQIALLHAYNVYISDVHNLATALQMIAAIGQLTAKDKAANQLCADIQRGFYSLVTHQQPTRVCYLIWQNPFMTVGGDTFISDMLQHAGFYNCFQHKTRYPVIEIADILQAKCTHLFLASEPFPFAEKHAKLINGQLQEAAVSIPGVVVPGIQLVNGEMFSWYGSRLLQAVDYFKKLRLELAGQHPE